MLDTVIGKVLSVLRTAGVCEFMSQWYVLWNINTDQVFPKKC